ncbi:hypothetical protein N2603_37795 [Bradyrhizobium huanghuaihaiense]|uniref:hypothetical protein n=1 Tax=Bradyrhizobium huanghuaihaiense TaxID=990078 RepID=UPI0021A9DB83|nr:hypothetical protein [Bradyrhizobium sp. CB3035]UWU75693.1 hypothetical protein N2603_37795 [Bradyrhizobium sp. CB3035]
MTKPQVAENPSFPVNRARVVGEASTAGVVVLGIDFRSRRRERVYDADKIWSGEHSILDYTEI